MPRSIAFITGAGRGIGRALALRFAGDGYAVALAGPSDAPLRDVANALPASAPGARTFVCDVTDRASIEHAVAETEDALGPIDVLVNNAGTADSAPFATMSDDQWDRILAVNLTGTYLCMRVIVPRMFERRRGRVINIASVAGLTGFAYTAAYCAAKHGVVGLTRAVALEAAAKGVTVNAICPGWVDTDMTRASIERIVTTTGRTAESARDRARAHEPAGPPDPARRSVGGSAVSRELRRLRDQRPDGERRRGRADGVSGLTFMSNGWHGLRGSLLTSNVLHCLSTAEAQRTQGYAEVRRVCSLWSAGLPAGRFVAAQRAAPQAVNTPLSSLRNSAPSASLR